VLTKNSTKLSPQRTIGHRLHGPYIPWTSCGKRTQCRRAFTALLRQGVTESSNPSGCFLTTGKLRLAIFRHCMRLRATRITRGLCDEGPALLAQILFHSQGSATIAAYAFNFTFPTSHSGSILFSLARLCHDSGSGLQLYLSNEPFWPNPFFIRKALPRLRLTPSTLPFQRAILAQFFLLARLCHDSGSSLQLYTFNGPCDMARTSLRSLAKASADLVSFLFRFPLHAHLTNALRLWRFTPFMRFTPFALRLWRFTSFMRFTLILLIRY